jgi:hypothetical protein
MTLQVFDKWEMANLPEILNRSQSSSKFTLDSGNSVQNPFEKWHSSADQNRLKYSIEIQKFIHLPTQIIHRPIPQGGGGGTISPEYERFSFSELISASNVQPISVFLNEFRFLNRLRLDFLKEWQKPEVHSIRFHRAHNLFGHSGFR